MGGSDGIFVRGRLQFFPFGQNMSYASTRGHSRSFDHLVSSQQDGFRDG
jgi:hypothetical protein